MCRSRSYRSPNPRFDFSLDLLSPRRLCPNRHRNSLTRFHPRCFPSGFAIWCLPLWLNSPDSRLLSAGRRILGFGSVWSGRLRWVFCRLIRDLREFASTAGPNICTSLLWSCLTSVSDLLFLDRVRYSRRKFGFIRCCWPRNHWDSTGWLAPTHISPPKQILLPLLSGRFLSPLRKSTYYRTFTRADSDISHGPCHRYSLFSILPGGQRLHPLRSHRRRPTTKSNYWGRGWCQGQGRTSRSDSSLSPPQ